MSKSDLLLPNIFELKEYLNNVLNIDFDSVSFDKQLQIVCDIVRQSIYPNGKPNPDNDIYDMNGNCYTANLCLMNYLIKLGIGSNHRLCFVRKRPFDPEEITSIHFVLLVDNDSNTYQVDATPFVGYKFGTVDNITNNKIYDEYIILDSDLRCILYEFRKGIYNCFIGDIREIDIYKYMDLCNIVYDYPFFKGYAYLLLKSLRRYADNNKKDIIQNKMNILKPYNNSNEKKMCELRSIYIKEINKWREELNDLVLSKKDTKRQLELLIWIDQELINSFGKKEETFSIDNNIMRYSSMNPRYMHDNNYHCSFFFNNNDYIYKYDIYNTKDNNIDLRNFNPKINNNTSIYLRRLNDSNMEEYLSLNDFCDSSLNILSGVPNLQMFNRFMVKNPKFKRKNK